LSEWIHEFACSLPAPPEQVFAALIEPARLTRWFAEHAEVVPRVDGSFHFWGRHSYGAPSRSAVAQRIRAIEPSRVLAFTWRFHDVDSEVKFELAPDDAEKNPGGTRLQLRHTFSAPLAIDRPKELVDDLWRLHCGNLKAHLTGDDGLCLPDFTDPEPAIRVSIRIDAPRERVFRALLDPEILNRWIAQAAVVEPQAGGTYSYGWRYDCKGRQVEGGPRRILELVENEKLVTDWPDWRGDDTVPVQTITWLLEPDGDGTKVTLVHSGFVRAADASDYPFGWGGFLEQLEEAVRNDGTA